MAAVDYLKKLPDRTGKIGVVGFCWGGGMSNTLADARARSRRGACRSTARQAPVEDVPKIKAPLLIHYAENDERINAGAAAYEEALKANKVKYDRAQVPRHPARLQQRHHPPLRQGRRRAGLAADGRLLQEEPGVRRG